jgi:hypothetical protein
MWTDYISEDIKYLALYLYDKEPNIIFCGSFSLVVQNKLFRKVNDIDILTSSDNYRNLSFIPHIFTDWKTRKNSINDDNLFLKFKINNQLVDIWYNKNYNNFIELEFYGKLLKFQPFEITLQIKEANIKNGVNWKNKKDSEDIKQIKNNE